MKILYPLALTLFLITGCSTTVEPPKNPATTASLELLITRTSLAGTHFEQYKVFPNRDAFAECGNIAGGRFITTYQNLGSIDEDSMASILTSFSEMIDKGNYKDYEFSEPGDNSSMFDPGRYEISFTTDRGDGKIHTSLDSITRPNSSSERALLQVARDVRNGYVKATTGGQALCENRSFYGIKAEKN